MESEDLLEVIFFLLEIELYWFKFYFLREDIELYRSNSTNYFLHVTLNLDLILSTPEKLFELVVGNSEISFN